MKDIYDVPVFTSLPSLIDLNKSDKNDNSSKKLYDISITDIYQDEPFTNNKHMNKFIYLILIFLIFLFFLILL